MKGALNGSALVWPCPSLQLTYMQLLTFSRHEHLVTDTEREKAATEHLRVSVAKL